MSKRFNQLYAKTSNGKIKTWIIESRGDTMHIWNGTLGGTMKEQTKKIVGKNQGKINATSNETQCEIECLSKWESKIKEQYVENIDSIKDYSDHEIMLPMLAQKYEERKKYIKFPCYVQPKLNGVRMIFQNGKFISRQGNEFTTLEHLRPELEILAKNDITMPDGEIYIHGMNFQEIVRLVKKDRQDGSNSKLEYWIYDEISNKPFTERLSRLDQAFADDDLPTSPNIQFVATELAQTENDIITYHNKYVNQGFEGIIIRNINSKYEVKHRSNDLQKWKFFKDSEFKIVGFDKGSGIEEDCIIFVCDNGKGKTFNVRPKGTHEMRKKWYQKRKSYINKMLIVRYQNLSEDAIPIFPVGICIRDFE